MEWSVINLIKPTQKILNSRNFPPDHHRKNVSLIASHTSCAKSANFEEKNRAAEVSAQWLLDQLK